MNGPGEEIEAISRKGPLRLFALPLNFKSKGGSISRSESLDMFGSEEKADERDDPALARRAKTPHDPFVTPTINGINVGYVRHVRHSGLISTQWRRRYPRKPLKV